jgi:hypothetical protein
VSAHVEMQPLPGAQLAGAGIAERSLAMIGEILRAPEAVARRCREERDLPALVATALTVIAAGSAVFGGVVGSMRGGAQILFAAIKMPLVILVTLALCGPAFHVLAAVFGRPWSLRTVVSMVLSAGARASLVQLALAPALWLFIDCGASYHAVKLAAVVAYGLAGLAALGVLTRGLGDGPGKGITFAAFVGLYLLAGGQTAWILRPYLGRPDSQAVPFLTREKEGGVADAVWTSVGTVLGGPSRRAGPR